MSQAFSSALYAGVDRVEQHHFWFRARTNMIRALIGRYMPVRQGKTFLEVGCGTGIVLKVLESMGFRVTGMDVNERALTFARKHSHATLVRQSFFSFHAPVPFDAIGMFDVLEHQRDDRGFLRRCNRCLKPHGSLFVTVPAGGDLWSEIDRVSGHKRRYEKDELIARLLESGFGVEYINYWNVFLLPVYYLWRLRYRFNPRESAHVYLTVPFFLMNAVWYAIFQIELWFTFRVPFAKGATLVVCARKKKSV